MLHDVYGTFSASVVGVYVAPKHYIRDQFALCVCLPGVVGSLNTRKITLANSLRRHGIVCVPVREACPCSSDHIPVGGE